MKALIFSLVIVLTASLGLAQDFDTRLDRLQSGADETTYRNVVDAALASETLTQLDSLVTYTTAQDFPLKHVAFGHLIKQSAFLSGDPATAFTYGDTLSYPPAWTAAWTLEGIGSATNGVFSAELHTQLREQLGPVDVLPLNHHFWRMLTVDDADVWADELLKSATEISSAGAFSALKAGFVDQVMLRLYNADIVTKQQAADFFDSLYVLIWGQYLSEDDQTTTEAQVMEKLATKAKSLRDMLAE